MATHSHSAGPEEIWRGAAPAAACGPGGEADLATHLFIAMQGLAGLAAGLGLNAPFAASAPARLRVKRAEIRILSGVRAGDALSGAATVEGASECGLTVRIAHALCAGDRPAAEVVLNVDHVSGRTGERFAWPRRVASRLEAAGESEPPDPALPRKAPAGEAVGRGLFGPGETEANGRVRPDAMLARLLAAAGGGAQACELAMRATPEPGHPYAVLADPGAAPPAFWLTDSARGVVLARARFEPA